ncbi:MAG: hypothetical protein DRO67_00390 [Candidatus Asgardarchaeum californiense]|nr:MAG: hypothetical protein DRO67_00390 [Candidatus Asgardarchaeum californiense]
MKKLPDTLPSYYSPRISSELPDCSSPLTFDTYSRCSMRCQYCVPKGSGITMADGTIKKVEEVIVGDILLGYNEKTKKPEATVVKQCMKHTESMYATFVFSGNGGSFSTTLNHPIFTKEQGWIDARYVKKGMHVLRHNKFAPEITESRFIELIFHKKVPKGAFSENKQLYPIWNQMVQRCHNPNAHNFKYYGLRGVQVCKEWRYDPRPFYKWAEKQGYRKRLELDRISTNGDYTPSNCRWVTHKENSSNRNKNGKDNKTGYTGIYQKNGRFYIRKHGKNRSYTLPEQAAILYDRKVKPVNFERIPFAEFRWEKIKYVRTHYKTIQVHNFECWPNNDYCTQNKRNTRKFELHHGVVVSNCFSHSQKDVNPGTKDAPLQSVDVDKLFKMIDGTSKTKEAQLFYKYFFKDKFLFHWGGLADSFCHYERKYGTSYEILKGLLERKYPLMFSSKGPAITDDKYIQLFEQYAYQNTVAFQFSIVTADDSLAKKVEPGVPSPTERLEYMKMLSDMGYWCLDKDTEIFHKTENSPYVRKSTLQRVYKTGNTIQVNCNGKWKEAYPMRIEYSGYWYKVTLRNGAEIIQIDKHENFTDSGIKKGENLKVGDRLLVSTKPMNWDCSRGTFDLGRFVGLWVAEGCYIGSKQGFKFTYGTHEEEYIQFTRQFAEKLGGAVHIQHNGSWTDVIVYSNYIKTLLDSFIIRGRTCDTITLDDVCHSMSKDFKIGLLAGWEEGDGNDKRQIGSTSIQLIKDMFVLANSIGVKCSMPSPTILQVCDILTKNAKVYKFNPNTSPYSRKMYSEVVSIEKYKRPRIKYAYCLEVPEGNSFELTNGIVTHNCVLRLRPFIIGVTDETLPELLQKAYESGAKAISTEFYALDHRCVGSMRKATNRMGELMGIKDIFTYFTKLSPKERGGYNRLNRLIKEPYVKYMYTFCQEHDMVFACSDPDYKELCSGTANCCGLPPKGYHPTRDLNNWSSNQLTSYVMEARIDYHKTGKLRIFKFDEVYGTPDWIFDDIALSHQDIGCTKYPYAMRKQLTLKHLLQEKWNNLKSYANPRNYLHGKIVPIGVDNSDNMLYRYNPSAYEEVWTNDGVDLSWDWRDTHTKYYDINMWGNDNIKLDNCEECANDTRI